MSKRYFISILLPLVLTAAVWAGGRRSPASSSGGGDGRISFTTTSYQLAPLAANPKIINFLNEKFNADIQVWNIDQSNYTELLNLKLAANEIPDFFRAGPGDVRKYYEQGILAPIPEDLFKQSIPRFHEAFSKAYPAYLNLNRIDGKIWAVNASFGNPYRQPVIIRGDWLDAVGKPVPETLAEMEEVLTLFANNDPDRNGIKDTYGISNTAFNLVYGAYGYQRNRWFVKDGALVQGSIQPEMKDALTVLNRWYKAGLIDPEFITGENKGGYWAISHAFIEGRIGITLHGAFYHWEPMFDHQNITEMQKINPAGADSIVWGVPVAGPGGKKGLNFSSAIEQVVNCFGVQIENQPEKMAKILEIQNWITAEPDNWGTIYYGFKGEDWDFNERDQAVRKEGHDVAYINSHGGHTVMLKFGGPYLSEPFDPIQPRWLEEHGFYNDGYMDELLVQLPSAGTYLTELNKIEDEAYIAIITGERPLSYFDQFVAQWRSSGGDVLTREANAWYDTVK
jgi:putative aldouronate transport system substrate-binding protein